MTTPGHEVSASAAGDDSARTDIAAPKDVLPVASGSLVPLTVAPETVESAAEATSPSAEISLPADSSPPTTLPGISEVIESSDVGGDSPPVSSTDAEEKDAAADVPVLFNSPEIREVLCLHELRIGEGRTMVQVRWAGWGILQAEAVLDGQVYECRLMYGVAREREIDFLVPMGSTLTISVQNLWGSDRKVLEVLASDPVLPRPVVPMTPNVINVRMRYPMLPHFPSDAIARLIPSQLRVGVRMRQPLPSIDDRLRHAIAIESRRVSNLPWVLGSAQRYQRDRMSPRYERQPLSPSYPSLAVSDIKMIPVRDKLKAWMVEIHHGEDETESG